MDTILDKGPAEPKPPEDQEDAVAEAAYKAAVKDHHDWHEAHKEPIKVQMHSIDAQHAVSADPERYELLPPDERVLTIEERVTRLEHEVFPEPAAPVEPPKTGKK